MRAIPTDSEAVEALGVMIGPLTGTGTFNWVTDERAATVLLDYGTAKVVGHPPVGPMAIADMHTALQTAHATGNIGGIGIGGWIKILQTILGIIGPIIGNLPTA